MSLAVATALPRVSANAVSAALAAFTPPANSYLVVISHANSNSGASVTCAITNSVSALTWSQATFSNFGSSGQPGGVFIHVAKCPSSITNTVITATTTNNNSVAGDRYTSIKGWVVTGEDASPIGGSNKGGSTTNNLTTTGFTTLAANSCGFCGGTDWSGAGTPVSSNLTGDGFNAAAILSGFAGYRTSLGAAGVSATFNLDAAGTAAAQWNWCSIEIEELAAIASGAPPPNQRRRRNAHNYQR